MTCIVTVPDFSSVSFGGEAGPNLLYGTVPGPPSDWVVRPFLVYTFIWQENAAQISKVPRVLRNVNLAMGRVVKSLTKGVKEVTTGHPLSGGQLCSDGAPTLWVVWKRPLFSQIL